VNRALGIALLFVLAAAYLRLGMFIPIEFTDEGVIVYPIWRVAEGVTCLVSSDQRFLENG